MRARTGSSHDTDLRRPEGRFRRGVVLIIVLVVIVTLSLSAYTFSRLMLTHRHAANLTGQQLQTRMLVDSGVELIRYYLLQDELSREEMGGHYNNPAMFQGVTVLPEQDLAARGSFAVVAPLGETSSTAAAAAAASTVAMGSGVRYGLADESTRLNLNVVLLAGDSARDLMMGIPGMTEELADSILDWIDTDDEPREFGAELDFYASLNPSYEPRNGPLLTVEELLLVRGMSPQLLFGQDQNRNTIADAHELGIGGSGTASAAAATTSLGLTNHRGLSAYLTIYSAEKNVTAEGLPRVNVNGDDMQQLHTDLTDAGIGDDWANFIVAYRIYGPYDGNEQNAESAENIELDLESSPSASAEIGQLLDLIGAQVQISQQGEGGGGGQQQGRIFDSPFQQAEMLTYLHVLMDTCTAVDAEVIPGRINVNEASPEILLGIPGMSEEIVEQLIQQREILSGDLTSRDHATWLVAEAVVTLEEMKALSPYLCAGGDVFRTQIVGYYQGGGPSTRVEVVFDATAPEPRVVLWRDISHLGRGYPLEMLGIDLTAGTGI